MDKQLVVLEKRRYQTGALTHDHDFHQVILPMAGQLYLKLNRQEQWVNHHYGAIIPAGASHTFEGEVGNLFLVADIPATFTHLIDQLPTCIQMNRSIDNYTQFLNKELSEEQATLAVSTQNSMILLLLQLMQEQNNVQSHRLDVRAKLVKEYIEKHYVEVIAINQLASLVHLSSRQLSTVFANAYGVPPLQYQLQLRMKQAEYLLMTSSLTIQQVAERVGYSSLSAFSDRFRRYFGLSPRYFRQSGKL